jgi:hypothetical protein
MMQGVQGLAGNEENSSSISCRMSVIYSVLLAFYEFDPLKGWAGGCVPAR